MEYRILEALIDQSGSIIPITFDKRSIIGWDNLRDNPASKEEVKQWVTSGEYQGYGVVMNNGFHCIDIDQKNTPQEYTGSVFQEIWKEVPESLQERLIVQRSVNGGEHIIGKCPVEAKPLKLVENPATNKPIIEIIGSKGYIKIYDDVPSGSWEEVPTISEIELEWLHNKAKEVGDRLFTSKTETFSSDEHNSNKKPKKNSYSKKNIYFVSASASTLEREGIDITEDYETWRRIGYGIANDVGEQGRQYFHKISAINSEYDFSVSDNKYTSFLKGGNNNFKASLASLRYVMKEHGVAKLDEENKTTFKIKSIIKEVDELRLRRNNFTSRVERRDGTPIEDSDLNDLYASQRIKGVAVSLTEVSAVVGGRSHIPEFNPLRDWLLHCESHANQNSIVELIDSLILNQSQKDDGFIREMILKWLLQIPAMIMDGVNPRLVLTFIGNQSIGKTYWFSRLLPNDLRIKYYTESGLDREKDSEILMSEKLLINIDELAGLLKTNRMYEKFKYLVSAEFFNLRAPYGKHHSRYQRKAILCATSNDLEVIKDHSSGNTRIVPVQLDDINQAKYNCVDRQALFGALLKLYREKGADYLKLTIEERDQLQSTSNDYTSVNVEKEIILKYFEPVPESKDSFRTVSEICDLLSKHTDLKLQPNSISRELNKLGFKKGKKRVNRSKNALSGFYCKFKQNLTQELEGHLLIGRSDEDGK